MPFLFVQLPSWTCVNWEYMRWDQFRTCKELKNVGMAVAIDTGLEDDVHPLDKLPFIERLSKIALRDVYGKKDALGYGPLFKSAKISGDRAAYEYLPASVLRFPGPEKFKAIMEAAGFSDVRHKSFTFGICRMYTGVK